MTTTTTRRRLLTAAAAAPLAAVLPDFAKAAVPDPLATLGARWQALCADREAAGRVYMELRPSDPEYAMWKARMAKAERAV